MKKQINMLKTLRYLCLAFVFGVGLVAIIGTGGGGGSGSAPGEPPSNSAITGSAVKGPVENAEVHVYYFDANGTEVEIISTEAPVFTDAFGAFSFPIDGTDLMGITSPLVVRTEGGSMYGGSAPTLAAVIADPQPLTFARVTVSCHLSAASSVAAGLLGNLAQSLGSAPTLEDAQRIITRVENQLRVDLDADPSDLRSPIAMFNHSIDRNLDLAGTNNNPAVDEFIAYLVANLSSSSGLLDDTMEDPDNSGTDGPASFGPFPGVDPFSTLRSIIGDPSQFILMTLASDSSYVENDGWDSANITATLMDAKGSPYQDLGAVQLGLVSGPGILMSAGLSYARGEVVGELTSDMAGNTGDIIIRANYPLDNGNDISLEILVQALDFYVDSDGDGLSDGDEQVGQTLFVDVAGFGLTAFADKLVKYENVTSDPNLADTDGDGLDDQSEYVLETHPGMVDTDGDGLTDAEEVNRWQTNPLTVDTDFDAGGLDSRSPNPKLFDGNELAIYRTSPSLQDTDGDGRTEFEEIFLLDRNPLVSDLPTLEMEIVDAVDVRLDVAYAEEAGETFQYGSEMMKSATRSVSRHKEHSIETGFKLGISTTTEAGFGFPSCEITAKASTTVSTEFSFGYGFKWSTTTESANTTQQSYSRYTTDSRTRTETAASGSMSAGIRLRNPGDIAYTILKLGIAVRHGEQVWEEDRQQLVPSFRTVATLVPALGDGLTLAPGEETPVLQVQATDLNADRVKALLRRPDSLYLEDEYFELEDAGGLNYAYLKEINLTRTASIVIDPGQGNAETYRVATNVRRGPGGTYAGVTLGEILGDMLDVDFATINRRQLDPDASIDDQVLFRVGNVETDLTNPEAGFWSVVHESENPPAGVFDFADIPVKAGDRVLLIYAADPDNNEVYDLHEEHYGIHDKDDQNYNGDYDGDGLDDRLELEGWRVTWTESDGLTTHEYSVVSDPAVADPDGDGWNDSMEEAEKTNPSSPDTDRDGIPDGEDPWPLNQAKVLYVDQDAPGDGSGSSWENAYTDLQPALSAARSSYENNDPNTPDAAIDDVAEIWVAQGVYTPSAKDVSFELVPAVGVYGGFRGKEGVFPGETKRSQRDRNPLTNSTVLSGDLNGNDSTDEIYTDNSMTIVQSPNDGTGKTVLDGFQIRGGNHAGTDWGMAGGMNVTRPMILRNLFFIDNRSIQGPGALKVDLQEGEELTISRCVFSENHSTGGSGGAVLLYYNQGIVSITDCKFQGNTAMGGGAIATSDGDVDNKLILTNTVIINNLATEGFGGGIFIRDAMPLKIVNSKIISNSATGYHGGGLYAGANTEVQVIQSVFSDNTTDGAGGGIFIKERSRISIVNSTFLKNVTKGSYDPILLPNFRIIEPGGGGGICVQDTSTTLRIDNSILWGNTGHRVGFWNQIGYMGGDWTNWTINTSCIQGYTSTVSSIGFGNVNLPVDVSEAKLNGDGSLKAGCACIDAGNMFVDFEPLTAGFQTLPEIDLAGKPRLADGDDNGFADVDLGAYEYQP